MIFKIHTPRKVDEIKNFTNSLHPAIRRGLRLGLNETGRALTKYTRQKMRSGPFTGRSYKVNNRNHRASATGEFPHRISGNLSRSMNYKTFGSSRLEYGSTARYSKFLEDGTRKMGARKFLKQSVKEFDKQTEVNLIKRVNIEIKKTGIIIK